jgi:hypothetical protein
MDLKTAYRNYIDYEDKQAEEFLIYELYKQTQYWLKHGEPDLNFLFEFLELSVEFEEEPIGIKNLLYLGLKELIEALDYYNLFEKSSSTLEKHLNQALMSFLAWIDEPTYRKMKNTHFSESDFYIYEIIGGEFPHDSAQTFLKTTTEVDVWIVIKYLEEITDQSTVIEIIESLLHNLKVLPDKYMLIAYFILRYPDLVKQVYHSNSKKDVAFFSLPADIHYEKIYSIFKASEEFLFFGELRMNFYEKIKNPKHESIVLLALLTMFEITNTNLTPAWIEVFERSIGNLWSYKYRSLNQTKKHQLLPEFAANIIAFLSEEEQKYIYETSKIFIIFFENIHRYSKQTFEEISDLLSLNTNIFEEELQFHLYLAERSPLIFKRLEICASKIYKKIIRKRNTFELIDAEEF